MCRVHTLWCIYIYIYIYIHTYIHNTQTHTFIHKLHLVWGCECYEKSLFFYKKKHLNTIRQKNAPLIQKHVCMCEEVEKLYKLTGHPDSDISGLWHMKLDTLRTHRAPGL